MKIPVLIDLHKELNRLFIAGARFAAKDPRITKLMPALTKMGERSPAMKKLADKTQELLDAKATQEQGDALADLGVLPRKSIFTIGKNREQRIAIK